MKRLIPSILVLILSASVNAETIEEKMLKLQAANDALTERVAELLQENRRLQKAVQDALNAQQTGARIANGCQTADLQRAMAMTSSSFQKNLQAMRWLKTNGEKCKPDQLRLIIQKLKIWGNDEYGVYTEDAQSLARFYLEN